MATYELRGTDDGHVDDVYHANIEYKYIGVKYTKLGYKDHVTEDKTYTIYVDKDNPEYITTEYDGIFWVLYAGGTLFILLFVIGSSITLTKYSKFKKYNSNANIRINNEHRRTFTW